MVGQDWECEPAGHLVESGNVCQRLRGQNVVCPGSQSTDIAACHTVTTEQGVNSTCHASTGLTSHSDLLPLRVCFQLLFHSVGVLHAVEWAGRGWVSEKLG